MHAINHKYPIISLSQVSYSYEENRLAVQDISFDIHKGDYIGLIGPNGGGKTTILKIMLGLLVPNTGTVSLFGKDIRQFTEWHRIGYVPQRATVIDQQMPLTVEEVVLMGTYAKRGLFRMVTPHDKEKMKKALEEVDMLEFRKRNIADLSGGQQQRVFIARALAGDPAVMFLDEPTVGVDTAAQKQFYALLKRLNQNFHITLLLVSHELDVVAREATKVACIHTTLACFATPEDLSKDLHLQKMYGETMKRLLHHHHSAEREGYS